MSAGYKPEIDPRMLRAALKQKSAYYAGGQLNMVKIDGTNALKQKVIDEAEAKNQEPLPEDLKQFETDVIVKRQEEVYLALKSAVGNAALARYGASNIPIKECTF